MSKTRIFVSSTCYDLSQIRRDIEDFIINTGHEPVLSDSPRIAIPSGLNKIEACKWLVSSSDIFILIIGGRLGSTESDSGKSITNIEYDTAYGLEMPIYTFVEREVWDKKDTYRSLKDLLERGEISEEKVKEVLGSKIENPSIYEFINRVENAERDEWIYQFSHAKDIVQQLKNNLSLLLRELLIGKRNVKTQEIRDTLRPDLRVMLQERDFIGKNINNETDKLFFSPKPKLDRESVINGLKFIKPDQSLIDKIKKKKNAIYDYILHKLVFQKDKKPFDHSVITQCIDSALAFIKEIDDLIDIAGKDFERLENYNGIRRRSKLVDLIIYNDGYAPATDITIYLRPTRKIIFKKYEDLYVDDLRIPENMPDYILELLNLAQNIDNVPKDPIPNILKKIKEDYQYELERRSYERIPKFEHNFIFENKKNAQIFLQNDSIRIDIKKLTHNFHQTVNNSDISICSFLANGEVDKIAYECHADNLPKPIIGELFIETE